MKKNTSFPNLTCTIESKILNIQNILYQLKSFCNQHHIPSETIKDLSIATEESIANIIQHTYKNLSVETQIHISFFILANHFYIQLRDVGTMFDLNKSFQVINSAKKRIPGAQEGGYGLLLIKKLMDEVKFTRTKKYNLLTMKKNLVPN